VGGSWEATGTAMKGDKSNRSAVVVVTIDPTQKRQECNDDLVTIFIEFRFINLILGFVGNFALQIMLVVVGYVWYLRS